MTRVHTHNPAPEQRDHADREPLVSVVMPVYNAGEYLRPAVESILAQTHRTLELIVVDDGSTDGAVERLADIADPRVRVIHQENAGKSVAMNTGIDAALGEFVAVQDADDLSAPVRLERQIAALRADPDLAAVFCGHDLILGDRRLAPQFRAKSRDDCRADIAAYRMPAHDPTVVFRASMFDGVRYTPGLAIGEGLDVILRLGERHPMSVVGACLYGYRVHAGGITRRDPRWSLDQVQGVVEHAAARRGEPPPKPREIRLKRNGAPANCELDNHLAGHFILSVKCLRDAGRRLLAIRHGFACAMLHPLDPYYWRPLAHALTPRDRGDRESLVVGDAPARIGAR